MARIQNDWQHEYLLSPTEYPLSNNEAHSTYDQFIQLRDTLIFSNKYYNDKAGLKLIVWYKEDWSTTNTVEIATREYFRQWFEPWYEVVPLDPTKIKTKQLGKNVTLWYDQITNWLICTINRDGHYRLSHKEQFYQLDSTISKIHCYVAHHHKTIDEHWQEVWQVIPRAVFDWEWSWTLTWTTAWTDPSWTCSVTFTLGQLFQKITAFWYIEADLNKWDYLQLVLEKQWWEAINTTQYMQPNSNWWCVEYIDLPYNTLK